jgi:hypothetical protein
MAALLLERAEAALRHGDRRAVASALRLAAQDLAPRSAPDPAQRAEARALALGEPYQQ